MKVKPTKQTFESIILLKSIPYWLYWPAFGIITFIVGEILIWAYADNNYFFCILIGSISLATIPLINIRFFYSFKKLMQEISVFFWDNNEEFERWYNIKEKHIFTLSTWQAKLIVGLVFICGLITIILIGYPYRSRICNIVEVSIFSSLLMFCGITLYISFGLLSTLKDIVKLPNKIPFFMTQHPIVYKLHNYYLTQTLFLIIYYIVLVIAIWQGPYGFNNAMLVWLAGVAFYPLIVFSWSFFQIHTFMRNIKQSNLEIINSKVQSELNKVLNSQNSKDVENLEKIMNIQSKIHSQAEWPVSFSSGLVFLTTLATATAQILVSYFKQ